MLGHWHVATAEAGRRWPLPCPQQPFGVTRSATASCWCLDLEHHCRHEEQSVLGDVGHGKVSCTPWPLVGQASNIHVHQQGQATAKWAGSSHTVIVGAQDCSSSLSKVGVGCTLLLQCPWWLWDWDAQSPLGTGGQELTGQGLFPAD